MTLVDSMGSLAVASKGRFQTGISTDINATFVKPGGKMGDSVSVLGEVVSMGMSSNFFI
jgi:acyl-coenzyme A thioesterase 13